MIGERWWWGRLWAGRGRRRRTRPLREQARRHRGPGQHARLLFLFFMAFVFLVVNIWWKCDRLVFEIWKDGSKSIAMCAWILINGVFGGGNAITCWLVASSSFFSRDWIDGTEPSITCWFNWWYRITTCRLIALFMAGLMMQNHVVLLGWW